MESVTFLSTKNNKVSAEVNSIKLHSLYDPEKEAERYAENLSPDFVPSQIVITEPAVSYILPFLRKKFPLSQICCIRYTKDFERFDSGWDKVVYFTDENQFEMQLENFSEEQICSTFFIDWKPSSKAFSEINLVVWEKIKNVILRSRSILITRSFFAERWIINQINFCRYLNKTATIQNGSQDVLICASGLSLENSIEKIKKFRNDFFLIAVSSSLSCLLENKIIPDMVLSTDGGWWAQKHLEQLEFQNIPLALATEGNCQKNIINNSVIIPLEYKKDFDEEVKISKLCNIPSIEAERNGTVSGTALELALKITTGKIYFCGLDLHCAPGFQHSSPNKLEILNSTKDFKLKPCLNRLVPSVFNSSSLEIYEKWFKDNSAFFGNRVFRLSNDYKFLNSLNLIQDINFEQYEKQRKSSFEKILIKNLKEYSFCKDFAKKYIEQMINNINYQKNIFPAEYLSYQKEKDDILKQKKFEELQTKIKKLAEKITEIING